MIRTVFFSTMTYALGKERGHEGAAVEWNRQVAELSARRLLPMPAADYLPAARMVARLRTLAEVECYQDCGATSIGKARSRAFHVARQSKAEAWVACDDDVECTTATLEALLLAVSGAEPAICIAPVVMRGGETVGVCLRDLVIERELMSGHRVRRAYCGGWSLVAMNRAAIQAMPYGPHFLDDDGVEKTALFHDVIRNGIWLGEDLSFFTRVPSFVRVEALLTGTTNHAGQVLMLDQVEHSPRIGPEHYGIATGPELDQVDDALPLPFAGGAEQHDQ